jgi:hypothetical protein
MVRVRLLRLLALLVVASCALVMTTSAAPESIPEIEMKQVCGALLRDSFSSATLDTSIWTVDSRDPGIKVEIENGELCVHGTGSAFSEEALRNNPVLLQHWAGVWSRPFAQTDVELAVRVKIPSGIAPEPGSHVVNVHLCGIHPDAYPEILFGKLESTSTKRLIEKYNGLKNLPWPDARGWWFSVVQGTPTWQKVGEAIPDWGDEATRFHEVVVGYDEPTRMAHARIHREGKWLQLGEDRFVSRGATMVELKMISMTDQPGFHREARFDDCRLYLNPRRNPIRLIVTSGRLPYRGPALRAELRDREGKKVISQADVDREGMAYLNVNDDAWVCFPVSATIRLYDGETEVGRGVIDAAGIRGLYPGDVWVIDAQKFARPQ